MKILNPVFRSTAPQTPKSAGCTNLSQTRFKCKYTRFNCKATVTGMALQFRFWRPLPRLFAGAKCEDYLLDLLFALGVAFVPPLKIYCQSLAHHGGSAALP